MKAVILFAIVLSLQRLEVQSSNQPVIGIVSQEQTDTVVANLFPATSTYIYATYVKAVESAGGRVVPILPGRNESFYRQLLLSLNGVVFPGGNATLDSGYPYYDTSKQIYKIALELNEQGNFFPIFGVCLGFELLAELAANEHNLLKDCSVSNEHLPLSFTLPPLKTTLFSQLDLDQYHTLQFTNCTVNIHKYCVLVDDFERNTHLNNDWKITATSSSWRNGIEFVTTMEHARYPIFGVQFHPEVVPYEWSNATAYPRTENITKANQYFYDTLLHYARQNNHVFKDDHENLLIYNYPAVYTRYNTGRKRQIYLF